MRIAPFRGGGELRGLPNFTTVGLPDAAVREARERVRAALVNCGFEFPLRRIVINLAPAVRRQLPCRFMLLAAANPCPCGRGETDPDCSCAPAHIQRYQGKLSGALADRIDILAAVRQPSAAEIGGAPGEPSAAVRERVCAARERQKHRLGAGRCNAEMTPSEARARPRPKLR